ncbi:MAG: hypothetical protein ACYDCJ_09380 [Gammaproteobacteria bacterium]
MQSINRLSCIGLRIPRLARPVRLYLYETIDVEGMRIGYDIALQGYDDPIPILCETWFHEHGLRINELPLSSYSEISFAQQAIADLTNKNAFEPIISDETKPAMVLPYIGTREDLLAYGRDLAITDVRPAFMARRSDEAFECLVANKSGKQQALLRVVTSSRVPYDDFLLFEEVPDMTCDRDTWLTWLACDLSIQGWEVFWSDGYSISVSNVTISDVDDSIKSSL